MSALSYLGSRVALMVKVPPVPSSLADTFLVSGGAAIVFLHLPVELDGASSTIAQHSEEVRLPEWASELLLPGQELVGEAPGLSVDALAGVVGSSSASLSATNAALTT